MAQSTAGFPSTNEIQIVECQGSVEVLTTGGTTWTSVQTNQFLHPFDKLRTGVNSRMALRWSDQSVVTFDAMTELEILPPESSDEQCGLHLIQGITSFFHRDKPGRIRIMTRGAVAGVEGTEFVLAVNDAERTTLSVIDGKVHFGNEQATLVLTNGQQAIADLGKAPVRTAGFIANNLLQWCFYYPAVLDPDDLPLTPEEQKNLGASLDAYRAGDLQAALAKYPDGQQSDSDAKRIYHAALLLSMGHVESAQAALAALSTNDVSARPQRLAAALRELIAAVKHQPGLSTFKPQLATEFLADSYYEQSRANGDISLKTALSFAMRAATHSPDFGFAWERVAELEFSFGRNQSAEEALNKSLALAPRNAQALTLKGFLLAAQNQTGEAIVWFNRALAVDAALGNAWLGRGICRIRRRDVVGGREDLLMAAALEPQRAELRSYLGKAYANANDDARAAKELQIAENLDPNDPTPWLYSALINQGKNQINEAIRDLEKSKYLNDNRSVYRSQLLLDQDQAVRGANLAGIYRDAGMFDVSVREASRAVSSDYANYSAHLFLANSYEQLRDPNRSNLRYETPASAEFWIANLLAPASAGTLSPLVSERPNAKLFDQNRFGVVSDTTYLSRGAWFQEGAQFGTFDNFSYDFEAKYISDPGQRPNNDTDRRDISLTVKGQFTSQDSAFFSVESAKINRGDINDYYNQSSALPDLRIDDEQEPNLFLGYHREWNPGVHTLFFATRRSGDESVFVANARQLIGVINGGVFTALRTFANSEDVTFTPREYSTELQQIWEQANHTTILGTRYEWGDIRYQNYERNADFSPYATILFPDPNAYPPQDFKIDFHHFNIYGYHNWQMTDPLALTIGFSYDWLHQPSDVASTPFSSGEKTTIQFSPKVGFIWTPATNTTFRAAYTRSLSSFIDGQSYRLEPTEVAGFNQAFRSLIPDSLVGDTSGSQFDTFDVSLEQKCDTGTYFALTGEILYSKNRNVAGAYVYDGDQAGVIKFPTYTAGFNQSMSFRERSVIFTVDQLLGEQWSAGARLRVSQANLNLSYVDLDPANLLAADVPVRQRLRSVLHTVNLHANWNHPSGLFSIFEGNWYHQNNSGFSPDEPGDSFWQFNAYAGYRFWHRRAELTIGLLNITDQNYQLEPLNFYNEMARSRTLLARLRISF